MKKSDHVNFVYWVMHRIKTFLVIILVMKQMTYFLHLIFPLNCELCVFSTQRFSLSSACEISTGNA